jgi:hypothetical protein
MGDTNKKVEDMQKRLEMLQEEIDEARTEADNMDPNRPKETYAEGWNAPGGSGDANVPPG